MLSMADRLTGDPPSSFVVEWATRLSPTLPNRRRALDVAMGRGRHARVLCDLGLATFGIDQNFGALRLAMTELAAEGRKLRAWCADLTVSPLPQAAFELILVTRYLQRNLMPAIKEAVAPGGCVIYETFTVNQRALGKGPTSPHHLLEPGELDHYFEDFEILCSEELVAAEAVARLVARRPA
jgi:tellurite methyltransferase